MPLSPKSEAVVPAHQVQRNWGEVADRALRDPVVITAKGRPRHVLMAFDEYERLKARDRRAYRIEISDDLAALLEAGLDELGTPSRRWRHHHRPRPRPSPADVRPYGYPCSHQLDAGRDDPAKERPCVVVIAVGEGDNPLVTVAPITSRNPARPEAIALDGRLIGLYRASWVIPWELNAFRWPGPDVGRATPSAGAWWRLGSLNRALRRRLADRVGGAGRTHGADRAALRIIGHRRGLPPLELLQYDNRTWGRERSDPTTTLRVGIASYAEMKARTMAVAPAAARQGRRAEGLVHLDGVLRQGDVSRRSRAAERDRRAGAGLAR